MTKRTLLVAGATVALIAIAWYFLLWSPANHRLDATRSATGRDRATQLQLESRLAALVALDRQLPALRAELRASEPELPTAVAVDTLIDQISTAAVISRVAWTNESQSVTVTTAGATTPAAASGLGNASTMAMTLDISGTYSGVAKFITDLEHLPRLLVLDSVDYSAGSSGQHISVTLAGRAFFDTTPLPATPRGAGGA